MPTAYQGVCQEEKDIRERKTRAQRVIICVNQTSDIDVVESESLNPDGKKSFKSVSSVGDKEKTEGKI